MVLMGNPRASITKGILLHLVSHHPLCCRYDCDVVKVGRLRVCLGCAVFLPVLLLVVLLLFGGILNLGTGHYPILVGGVVMGLPQILSLAVRIRSRPIKVLVKALLGVGVGSVLYGIYLLPLPAIHRSGILLACVTLAGILESAKVLRLMRICRECKHYQRMPDCEGLFHFSDDPGADAGK